MALVVDLVVRDAEGDVAADGVVGEEDVLRHVAEEAPVGAAVAGVEWHAVHCDAAGGGVEQPEQHVHERGLARSGTADDGEAASLADLEVDAVQGVLGADGVAVVDRVQGDAALEGEGGGRFGERLVALAGDRKVRFEHLDGADGVAQAGEGAEEALHRG